MSHPHCAPETEALARRILLHSRRRITQRAPALLTCVHAMPDRVRPMPGPLSTDGRAVWFHPQQVLDDFRRDKDFPARQLLHIIAHCLLGHLELRPAYSDPKIFDLAADLKAAQLAQGFCGVGLASTDGNTSYDRTDPLRPLYEALCSTETPWQRALLQRARTARLDDHTLWNTPPATPFGAAEDSGNDTEPNPPNWASLRAELLNSGSGLLPGSCAGLLKEAQPVTERGLSYAEFLHRFASPTERLLLDPDSFDPRWYHLGLELYGDIPLLEPSEISEPPLPDDLVIALDTSGSCSGEICTRFLKETLGILRDISAGAPRFRVLLLQCDTRIQSETVLESSGQVDDLFSNFSARGFGGTDFRPVFERVATLRQEGTLPRVRGLLYLSDGWGLFPDAPTDYPTVFLIPRSEDTTLSHVPNWITQLHLDPDHFTVKEANTP